MKYVFGFIIIILFGSCTRSSNKDKGKVGYISRNKVFEYYFKSRAMNDSISIKMKRIDYEIDSLTVFIDSLRGTIQESKNNSELYKRYNESLGKLEILKSKANKKYNTLRSHYNQTVWSIINTSVQNYGKENGFDMIYGVGGEGVIMYADTSLNLTNKIINYIKN